MRTFNGSRPIEEIIENFENHLFAVDRQDYDRNFGDWIVFRNGWIDGRFIANCLVCPFNGRFICNPDGRLDPDGIYNELSDMDGTPWYDELLDMIYVTTEGEAQ